jgi:transglutaminase-like putative cysteine protease
MNEARVDRGVLGFNELALCLVTLAVVRGFARLFQGGGYFWKIATLGIAAHLLAVVVRRRGHGLVVSAVVSTVGLALVGSLVFYADTTWALLPTTTTWDTMWADLAEGWRLFGEVRAPAPAEPGFVVAGGITVWVVAYLADWAAFRLWSTAEAVMPAATVFLFSAMLGRGPQRIVSTAAFAGAVLLFALLHRLARNELSANWLSSDTRRARLAVARGGGLVAAVAVVVGLVVGPALPGAGQEAVIPWRSFDGDGGSGSRVTVSPLVDIKARLVNQSNIEVFSVESPRADYWRLTSLDRFDGVAWTSSGTYQRARDELPTRLAPSIATETLRQTFTIEGLDALWMPAAYEPKAVVDDGDSGARYDAESGTLTVKEGSSTSDGLSYTIESRIPRLDAPTVQAGTVSALPRDFVLRYTQLPTGLRGDLLSRLNSQSFRREIGLSGGSRIGNLPPSEQARRLQDWFRNTFTYDLQVANGHDVDDIASFLSARTGYCEQFAGTFAAMMRALGVPARVAVGFTPGELEADGVYRVRGEHAHAWPEVYLDGVGWVRYEPTPGRGAPGSEAYTGVAPQQAVTSDPVASAPIPEAPPTTAAPTDPTAGAPVPEDADLGVDTVGGAGGTGSGGGTSRLQGIEQIVLIAALVTGLAALAIGAVPVLKGWQRRQRRRAAATVPRQRIGLAWADAVDALDLLALRPLPSETPDELARRAEALRPELREPLHHLADVTTRAAFDARDPDPSAVQSAEDAARLVRDDARQTAGWRQRLRRALDPRPLLPNAGLR